jgi:hypothetical protein
MTFSPVLFHLSQFVVKALPVFLASRAGSDILPSVYITIEMLNLGRLPKHFLRGIGGLIFRAKLYKNQNQQKSNS